MLEVRQRGINKGVVVPELLLAHPQSAFVAIGDDRTDEDLFAASPPEGVTIHVGTGQSGSGFALIDVEAVHEWLRRFLEGPK